MPLSVAPIAYFDKNCARCHGAGGSRFGATLGSRTPQSLGQVVQDMAAQTKSPLSKHDLAVQVAFHRSIHVKKPFLAWTSQHGNHLKGEMTYGAKMKSSHGKVIAQGSSWSVELPKGVNPSMISLTASVGQAKTSLQIKRSAYSRD